MIASIIDDTAPPLGGLSLFLGKTPMWLFGLYVMADIVVRRPSQNEAVVFLENGLSQNYQISYGRPHPSNLKQHRTKRLKCRLRRLQVEFLENCLSED